MEAPRAVRCSENEELVAHLFKKRQEMAEAKGISENLDLTLSNAYRNICAAKEPITTLKELSQIKGVGKWILRLMRGFFPGASSEASPSKPAAQLGKKAKRGKRYVPQKNSVAYALLITLYRGNASGSSFMMKQELIDAAEASGLSRTSIGPEKEKGKPGHVGSSARDWYTGWSCMKTLIAKGLVVKSSCPAKYMLTQEGQEAARECILRSGLVDSTEHFCERDESHSSLDGKTTPNLDFLCAASAHEVSASSLVDVISQRESNCTHIQLAHRNIHGGQADSSDTGQEELREKDWTTLLVACTTIERRNNMKIPGGASHCPSPVCTDSVLTSFNLRACTSSDATVNMSVDVHAIEGNAGTLAMPPHGFGEKFEDSYDVILILDDRENFGSRSRKVVNNIRSQFKIQVEVRRLPLGDGIWIVRHKQLNMEYVLDFIVERKKVDDLCSSIRDNRYRDQKLRLQRCGLQKLIYLVEGDPNSLEAAESIKTACLTTEILEGFDVQRTSGLTDTVRKYGFLTQAIRQYYSKYFSSDRIRNGKVCPSFDEFVRKCQDLEKMTVGDVFALQLMQVPQVAEEAALAVTNLYPTLLSLARAYSQLEGDVQAQASMLKNQSKMINAAASRNIFNLVWGT